MTSLTYLGRVTYERKKTKIHEAVKEEKKKSKRKRKRIPFAVTVRSEERFLIYVDVDINVRRYFTL